MRLYINLLLAGILMLVITTSESCKSNKEIVDVLTEKGVTEANPLDKLLKGLRPLSEAEMSGKMVTIDGVSMPVYDEKGNTLKQATIIKLFRDDKKIFEVYGDKDLIPKAVLVRNKTAADDIVKEEAPKPKPEGSPMETKLEYAPAFKINNMQGEEVELKSLIGKVVVMNFWFINCRPCVEEMPELNSLVKQYKNNKDVVFLAITHDKKANVTTFLKKKSFDYQILPDAQQIMDDYIVMGFPTNIVLDKKGDIQYQSMGFRHKIDGILNDEIRHALKK